MPLNNIPNLLNSLPSEIVSIIFEFCKSKRLYDIENQIYELKIFKDDILSGTYVKEDSDGYGPCVSIFSHYMPPLAASLDVNIKIKKLKEKKKQFINLIYEIRF